MGCRASVEAALQRVAGTRQVQVDLPAQTALVVFDPVQTDADVLRAVIVEVGYKPKRETHVEADSQS